VPKFGGGERLTHFNTIRERNRVVVRKINRVICSSMGTMHERDRQTDRRWTDHETVTSMAIGEIAFSEVA